MKFLVLALFAPLVSAWSVSTYVGGDETCSTSAVTTITDVAPGQRPSNCVAFPEGANITSIKFDPSAGNGPFTNGGGITFYQSIEFCGEGLTPTYAITSQDTQELCYDAKSQNTVIGAYQV
ncbi:hypothetical protein CONPUDRAFT_154428 [Coniophora puteana RWD-64-598 SS2]|uniref:Uncharacterized protein n=1 Tax=Coniophora puteana (strain RWD-64-598) TaxID=741705 RepID=A0A5M3MMZ3_CONPW|nr:uncharacterized protein CONPUDRAFT_154428 [Coniophora puteana RWD-64-598 SS2]EIW80396.1 hypothetical protein CONPUDRAFT_154428 [Coniophora puteana RWD-64-598 SS2]